MAELNLVSLFDGIGGFPLGFQRAGVETVATVEIDSKAAAVSARHFPNAKQFVDVKEVTADDLSAAGFVPETGIIAAGWPCQDLSVAGLRAGLEGSRSGLWWEVVRILRETRPRWFIGENVPGLLSSNGGRDMGAVLRSLEEIGYGVSYRVLDAQYFGVPQRRRRVFFVGHLGEPWGASTEVLFEPEGVERGSAKGRFTGASHPSEGTNRTRTTVPLVQPLAIRGRAGGAQLEIADGPAMTLRAYAPSCDSVVAVHENQQGEVSTSETAGVLTTGGGKPGQGYPAVFNGATIRRLTEAECERLQGFPDGWTDGQQKTHRYTQLGNAVAVPCVEWIARRLASVDEAVRNG